jgi:ubiquinone/menaquinone biosynthesis C-methylase UbiE
VARILRHFPFVRGLALTGSAAAGDAGADDDVDLLVTVAEGRLGTVFVLLGSLSRLLGRRLFCPNYYACEGRLDLGPANLYLARELAQARPLAGDGAALWRANPWLEETFPNAEPPSGGAPAGSRLQRVSEALVGGRVEPWRDGWRAGGCGRLEAAVRLAGDGPGSLLEVGAGSGRLLARLAERRWDVAGIDAAPRMLELARARVLGARLEVARAEELPFEDASFDAVVAVGVLEYGDLEASVRELARVLRPGGRAVLAVRNSAAPTVAWSSHVMHPLARRVKRVLPFGRRLPATTRRPPSLRELSELLERVGLHVERVENVGSAIFPDPLDRLPPAYRAARLAEASPRLRTTFGTQRLIAARRTNHEQEAR